MEIVEINDSFEAIVESPSMQSVSCMNLGLVEKKASGLFDRLCVVLRTLMELLSKRSAHWSIISHLSHSLHHVFGRQISSLARPS